MKALTIKQPWAWFIMFGGKDIENRTWQTHYRGLVAIHAGLSLDKVALPPGWYEDDLQYGVILGFVDLVDVITESSSEWFDGPFGWVFENARPLLTPIPAKGRLGLWDWKGES